LADGFQRRLKCEKLTDDRQQMMDAKSTLWQGELKRILKCEYLHLKSTCDVNLLSKLSIILKEWRVMNNVDRGRVIVLFVL
jgi:hypothetical protein